MGNPRLLFVVNADWFFVSHRLRLATACREAGFEVHVAAGESEARIAIEKAGFTFHPIYFDRGGTNPFRDARTIRELSALYREIRPAVVHHVTVKPVVYGGLVARLRGIPRVSAVSGLGYVFIPQAREGFARIVVRFGVRLLYRFALGGARSRVHFQNDEDRDTFVRWKLTTKERTDLLPGSGVNVETFANAPLPSGPKTVLLPARLLRDKGVHEFVEAVRIARQEIPDLRAVLVGRLDPGNPAAIERSVVERWVREGCVEWKEDVPHAEMPAAYQSAHVVVLPSYREGLPLALAEAQSCGRPVVTTDVPGCRDAILPDETGLLVPARDGKSLGAALVRILRDDDELARWASRARAFAEARFREERIFAQILGSYRALGVRTDVST